MVIETFVVQDPDGHEEDPVSAFTVSNTKMTTLPRGRKQSMKS